MKYQSKKDSEIFAALDFQNEKTKTYRMIYLTGDKAGYSFEVAGSTLKRWWKKVEATKEEVDAEIINTPYNPDVTPHYIPKPQSVIEYEEGKKRGRYNGELPDFESMSNEFASITKRINETSKYIAIKDSDTTIWRKSMYIDIYADNEYAEKFVSQGLTTKPNKDKKRPFHIQIKTSEEYDCMRNALID